MRSEKELLEQFQDWAEKNPVIRAAILTSSRVNPEPCIDILSDYDIELYVKDLELFRHNDDWLSVFGPILVRWPLKPRATFDENWITRLVLFQDGVRIDFQITDHSIIDADAYDNGYKILLDKDNLTSHLKSPTFSGYLIKKPSQEEYETIIHEFWWDSTYVAKYLWRDELYFAKYMFDNVLRFSYLQKVIEWHIGMNHNWSVSTNKCGRWFKRYLDADMWAELEATFAGADIEDNWNAFFKTVAFFRKLAKSVGESLGYTYPSRLDKDVTAYYESIRNLPQKNGH